MTIIPTPTPTTSTSDLMWPPDRFYWAVIDGSAMRRGASAIPVSDGVGLILADELPVPTDHLHAVAASTDDGRLLVCAAPRDQLASLPTDALSLTPSELPDWASASIPAAALNLLTGEFEPTAVRSARRRTLAIATGIAVACTALACLGLMRRAEHWRAEAAAADEARTALIESVLPPGDRSPADRDLTAELRRARGAAAETDPVSFDAAAALASVLAGWPARVDGTASSIAVDAAGASVSLVLDGDPTPFLRAIRPPDGWTLDEPRINTTDRSSRLSLRLRPPATAASTSQGPSLEATP